MVNGAWCGKHWLIVGVVEGVFEFVEGVFRKVGFLCEDKVMIEWKQLFEVCVDRTDVGSGDGELVR